MVAEFPLADLFKVEPWRISLEKTLETVRSEP